MDANAAARDQTIRLRDGRQLGYATYGEPGGQPVFAFHGTPGSRRMLQVADAPARRCGVRLIAPDRPGYGLSSPQPGRRLVDWPDDVIELADALGLERFALAGISGGGPYVAACAWKIPERVSIAAIASGMGPVVEEIDEALARRHRLAFAAMRKAPPLLHLVMASASLGWRHLPERLLDALHAFMPPADQVIVARPEVQASLLAGLVEAFRQGGRGATDELRLFVSPWGFRLEEIRAPVRLWHGEADDLVPCAMGRYVARSIPGCRAEFIPGAGHYWVFDHIAELLEALVVP